MDLEHEPEEPSILTTTMQTLSVLLGAVPESEVRLYSGTTEVIYFDVDQITDTALLEKVASAKLEIVPIVYRESGYDTSKDPERDYIIVGVATPLDQADIRFGLSANLSTFAAGLVKEHPDEVLFFAIEAPCDLELAVDIIDEDQEARAVEILVGEYLGNAFTLN